ncbi:MAG: hypothetical protein QXM96_00070 [Candidatus Woesearchaeota archaeon]
MNNQNLKNQNSLEEKYKKLKLDYRIRKIKSFLKNRKKFFVFIAFIFLLTSFFSFILINYLSFNNNFITGLPILGTRLVILTYVETNCNISLFQGWNLISFSCLGEDTNLKEFFGNNSFYNKSYSTILSYDSFDIYDPWKSYSPNLPNWTIQDLSSVSRKNGYWLYVENNSRIIINNSLVVPSIINLKKGWNLIGYPSKVNRKVNDTFDQIKPYYDYVFLYNASESEWKQYTWNSSKPSLQNLNYTIYDFGYWIYVLNETTLIITN